MLLKKIATISLILAISRGITLATVPFVAKAQDQTVQVTAIVPEQITYLISGDKLTFSSNYARGFSILNAQQKSQRTSSAETISIQSNQGTFVAVVNF